MTKFWQNGDIVWTRHPRRAPLIKDNGEGQGHAQNRPDSKVFPTKSRITLIQVSPRNRNPKLVPNLPPIKVKLVQRFIFDAGSLIRPGRATSIPVGRRPACSNGGRHQSKRSVP